MSKPLTNYTPADLVKLAVGAAPGLSAPAAWKPAPATGSAAANTGSAGNFGAELGKGLGKALAPVGKAVWNNGGKQTLGTGLNTVQGIGNTATGLANVGAGAIGSLGGGVGYLGGAATDAAGLTTGAKDWVGHNILRHTTNAFGAGLKDTFGGAADTLSGGHYDYDGTFAMPGQHAGTAVEQMRSGIRDELGRGSDLDLTFRTTNAVGDFAANQAGFGSVGRGMNVAAKALQGSRVAAPVLNTAAKTPIVGKPLSAAGNWMAGPAPAANMFRQSLPQYYKTVAQTGQPGTLASWGAQVGPRLARVGGFADDVGRLAMTSADEIGNTSDAVTAVRNPEDRPADAREYQYQKQMQQAQTLANAHETYGGALAPAVARGVDEHFNARISNLEAKNAPPEEINRVYDEYLQHVGKNMPVPEYEQLRHTVDQARPQPATPQLTSPEATQPNPQGGPSTAQKPPATEPPQPYVDAVTYADPAAREDLYARALTPLSEAKTPEQKAEVEKTLVPQLTEQVKATAAPEQVAAVRAVAQNPNSPEAVRTVEAGRNNFATEQAGGDQTKLQDPEFFGSVMGAWNGLGAPGQMAFMLGVPMALIGLLSGDGLTGILGGLGIGGLALGAGAMGMFGDQAQAATGKMMGDIGNFMGMIPDEARDANNFRPGSDAYKAFEAEVQKTLLSKGPEAAQKMIDDRTAQFKPLEDLYARSPSLAHSFLMGTKNAPETAQDAEALYQQMLSQVTQARDPNFLSKKLVDKATTAAGDAVTNATTAATNAVNSVSDWWNNKGKGASMNIAQEIYFKQAALKAARCWAGYEPVPGKAPYSENSCRPKRKKKKAKESAK